MVGVIGFEPTTTCSQSRYATRLRYTPTSVEYERWKGNCPGKGAQILLDFETSKFFLRGIGRTKDCF